MRRVIFIGGTGRCGTTLMRRMFATATDARTLEREMHVHIRAGLFESFEHGHVLTDEEITARLKTLRRPAPQARAALVAARDALLKHQDLQMAGAAMLDAAFGKQKIPVEDSPDNMWHGERLARVFPRALFLHMVRHPLQVLQSTQKMHWAKATYAETADYLAQSYARCLATERDLGGRCLRVRLEDLASDPTHCLKIISNWCDIDVTKGGHLLQSTMVSRRLDRSLLVHRPIFESIIGDLGY